MNLVFCHPEFEAAVRSQLNSVNSSITDQDILSVTELDLSNFDFLQDDLDVLSLFTNLKVLDININIDETYNGFWKHLSNMECLYLVFGGNTVDFRWFEKMAQLTDLTVSGGDLSGMALINLDALIPLRNLHRLHLHEFGSVDLYPLHSLQQLTDFSLEYADEIDNIDSIAALRQLKSLVLCELYVKDLLFLDSIPDHVNLDIRCINVCSDVDITDMK